MGVAGSYFSCLQQRSCPFNTHKTENDNQMPNMVVGQSGWPGISLFDKKTKKMLRRRRKFNTQFASQWDQNLGFSIPDWIRKGLQGKTNCTFLFGISKEIEWRFLRISISYRSGDILNLIFYFQGKSDFLWVPWRWVSGRKKNRKKKLIDSSDRLVL